MHPKGEAVAAIERAQTDLEQALDRLAELPAVDAGRLSYAAHALNNYLMVVSTIAHVLRKALQEGPDQHVAEKLAALNHATGLMKGMVRQLVMSEGQERANLIFLPVDLVRIAQMGCDEYESTAEAKSISIIRDLPVDPVVVRTDRVALGAVLDNVLSNAVKYSTPGGTIRVSVRKSEEKGICAITDAGPGIREDEAARLFTRGGKLSSKPTGGEESHGYGLAVAKDLLTALDGEIWFENDANGGATFSFSQPLQR